MSDYFRKVEHSATFHPDKAAKADLWAGERLFVGLNCFEPGQTQKVHAHAGADKFYYVCSGRARLTVGAETHALEAGDCLAFVLDRPTAFRNRTRKPARYAVVIVGGA